MSDVCHFKGDRNYQGICGAPAAYEVWGDPCSCTHVYHQDKCIGHPTCVEHAAKLRMVAVPVHRHLDAPFVVTRMRDLPARIPDSKGCSRPGGDRG